MTLASAFAFSLCSQRFRLPFGLGTTLAQTYDGVPMAVLDQPLVDKIHTPSVNLSGSRSDGISSFHLSKTPTFRRCICSNGNAEPIDCWLLSFDLEPVPASLYQRYDEDHS